MLEFHQIAVALLLALGVWLVFSNQRAREQVNRTAARFCHRQDLQFLDGTVSLASFGLAGQRGKPVVRRRFHFDYSTNGTDRHRGEMVLLGADTETLIINPAHMKVEEREITTGQELAM